MILGAVAKRSTASGFMQVPALKCTIPGQVP